MSTAPPSRSTTSASTAIRPARPGRRLPPAVAAPLLILAFALLPPPRPARAAVVEEIVAKVNNRIISLSEFQERGGYVLDQVRRESSDDELEANLKEAQDGLLANMITELLLLEKAESLLDLAKVRQSLVQDFMKQQNILGDDELAGILKEQNMTRLDLEEQLIRLAVPQEIINYEVRRKVSVSEAEIRAYYDSNARQWEIPPTVTFREIVLFYEPFTRDEARSRADGVVREFKGGADILELVQKYSESGTRPGGGLLGPLRAEDLHASISEAAFRLGPGEMSEPIDTGRSLHVIRIEEKTRRIVQTLDEVRDKIDGRVRQQKFRQRYDRYLRRLWKESHVEVMPKYRQYLIASPLDAPAS